MQNIRSQSNHLPNIGSQAAANRLKTILMTSLAMIAGMLPMSLSWVKVVGKRHH